MKLCFIDFEYIQQEDKVKQHLICCVIKYESVVSYFDLRESNNDLHYFLKTLDTSEVIFCGYAISHAEIPALCQVIDREWLISTKWIDLWTEFKMMSLTHKNFFTKTIAK